LLCPYKKSSIIYKEGTFLTKFFILLITVFCTASATFAGDSLELPLKEAFLNPEIIKTVGNTYIPTPNKGQVQVKNAKHFIQKDASPEWENYTVSINAKPIDWDKSAEFGIGFLYNNDDNYYELSLRPNESKIHLIKKIEGRYELLKSKGYVFQKERIYGIKVSALNSGEIQTWIDGSRIIWDDQSDAWKGELKSVKGTVSFFSFLGETNFDDLKIYPNDPPFISDINIHYLTEDSAEISWKVSYDTIAELVYDSKSHPEDINGSGYPIKIGHSLSGKEHTMKLTNLKKDTSYFYKIRAIGDSTTISKELTFELPKVAGAKTEKAGVKIYSFKLIVSIVSPIFTIISLFFFLRSQKKELQPETLRNVDEKIESKKDPFTLDELYRDIIGYDTKDHQSLMSQKTKIIHKTSPKKSIDSINRK